MKFIGLLAFCFCVLLCLIQDTSATADVPIRAIVLGAGAVKLVKLGLLKAGGLALLHSGVKQHFVPSISIAPTLSAAPTVPVVPAIVHHRRRR